MSDPVAFVNSYAAACAQIVSDLEALRTLQDRIAQDGTLITRYLASGSARPDYTQQVLAAAQSSVTQLLFTFDSGSPTQKAGLFALL